MSCCCGRWAVAWLLHDSWVQGVTWQPHDLSVKDKIISIIEPSGYQVFAADSVVRVNISVHISAVTAQRTASHYGYAILLFRRFRLSHRGHRWAIRWLLPPTSYGR